MNLQQIINEQEVKGAGKNKVFQLLAVEDQAGHSISMEVKSFPVSALNLLEKAKLEEQIIGLLLTAPAFERAELPIPFRLRAAASDIAMKTRRGTGNVVILHRSMKVDDVAFKMSKWRRLWMKLTGKYTWAYFLHTFQVVFVDDPRMVGKAVVLYRGQHMVDGSPLLIYTTSGKDTYTSFHTNEMNKYVRVINL